MANNTAYIEYEENGIGIRNESSLHLALKRWYAIPGDRFEVKVGGNIIDIVRGDLLIEIQTKNFSAIRKKLIRLLENNKIVVVFPIAVEKWITTTDEYGEIVRRRRSPQKKSILDIFSELVSVPELINNKNFALEVLLTVEEELRCIDGRGSWRRKGISIIDRNLIGVSERIRFEAKTDFLTFLPGDLPEEFTNKDLARILKEPVGKVQRATYCLKKMGLIHEAGKKRNELIYKINE